MLPLISRRLVWPVHERLVRRATLRFVAELEWSQYASPVELEALRREKLRALLAHAARHTVFYRDRIRSAGVDLRRDDPFTALHALPLLGKDEIRANLADMLWHDAPGGVFPHHTGGSTGDPLTFYFDRRRQAYDQAARIRTHRWFGVDHGDRELFLWGSPIEWSRTDRVKRFRDALFNHRLLSAFEMSPTRMDAYLDEIESYRPACLFGYPSSIALLVGHALRRGRALRVPSLRAIFVTGEVCQPLDREAIVGYFGVPLADGYGSREAGFIAHECPEGDMHVMAENVIVEVIRDGHPVPTGETGELVVTHLDAYAMPMIRYRTGDVGSLKPGRCACGRGLALMDVVDGRTTDFIHLPDGTVKHALAAIYPLREMPGIQRFRIHQRADYSVRVSVVPEPGSASPTKSEITQAMTAALGDGTPIDVEFVSNIPVTSSGKFRYVTSEAGSQIAGARSEATLCEA